MANQHDPTKPTKPPPGSKTGTGTGTGTRTGTGSGTSKGTGAGSGGTVSPDGGDDKPPQSKSAGAWTGDGMHR